MSAPDFDASRLPAGQGAAPPLPDPALPWPIPLAGVELIARAESLRLRAYRCPAGVWTCGWGETDGVGPTTRWDRAYADQRLCDSLTERVEAVRAACRVPTTPNELAGLVSFAYNCKGWEKSSVLRAHNRGDRQAAARAFALWNKARNPRTKKLDVLPGLTARRAAEAALYLTPDPDEGPLPMPQSVESEGRLAGSPIAQAGAATTAGGVLAAVSAAGAQLGAVQGVVSQARGLVVDGLGIPAPAVLPALLVLLGGVVLWWRWRQRRDGWA